MSTEQLRASGDVSGLLDLFDPRILWKRKWSVAFSVVVAVSVGSAYISQETQIFEVTSRMLVQLERFGSDKESLLRTDKTFLVTQGEIIRCPVVVENALKALQKSPKAPNYSETEAVINALRVATVDDANVLKLTYRHPDSAHAVRILQSVMDSYQEYIKEMQHNSIQETLQVLTQHERELRKEVEQLEERYFQLRKNSRLVGQGGDAFRSYAAMLEQLGTKLTEARGRRIDKEIQFQTLVNARGSQPPLQLASAITTPGTHYADELDQTVPIATTVLKPDGGNADVPASTDFGLGTLSDPVRIQLQLWQAENRAKETSQVFGPLHPTRSANESQIAMWRERLQEHQKAHPIVLAQELAALKKIEEHLTMEHEAEFTKVKSLDASLVQEQQCLADIQRVQAIHDSTAQQLRNLQFADATHTNGEVAVMVRLIERPDETAKLVWPRPLQFISLCAVMGFVAGCVLVTAVDRLTHKR